MRVFCACLGPPSPSALSPFAFSVGLWPRSGGGTGVPEAMRSPGPVSPEEGAAGERRRPGRGRRGSRSAWEELCVPWGGGTGTQNWTPPHVTHFCAERGDGAGRTVLRPREGVRVREGAVRRARCCGRRVCVCVTCSLGSWVWGERLQGCRR